MEQLSHTEWHLRPERAPELHQDDELIYDLPGRIIPYGERGTDYRSHWIRIVKVGPTWQLLVRHGAGDERFHIGGTHRMRRDLFDPLTDDQRYRLFFTFLEVRKDGISAGAEHTATKYRQAFVEGRLHKRKLRGQEGYKVWIE